MDLILASESPRRRDLLRQCGIAFKAVSVDADETPRPDETPEQTAVGLAREKARLAHRREREHAGWILAADTVVADGGQLLGKPRDAGQAREYLVQLRGRPHRVITGVCLLRTADEEETTDIAVTTVRMRAYSDAEVEDYLASGDPLDKAGAYAIQHPVFRPVESLDGCYTNVVGLPLCRVYRLLERAGRRPDRPLPEGCRSDRTCGFAPSDPGE